MKWTKSIVGLVAFATVIAVSLSAIAEAAIFIPAVPEPMGHQSTYVP